ncbi:MAG: DEAD/DEAH box helicase [Cyanobacteria bacterium J06642_2]
MGFLDTANIERCGLLKYQLRNYQIKLLQTVLQKWHRGQRRLLLQLPTGGGKTILFGAIAKELLSHGERVLILAHREELVLQAAAKVSDVTQQSAGIIKAGYPLSLNAPVQVASVQTLSRRLNVLQHVGMVVVDEAHHASAASYRAILQAFDRAYLLGVTATPIRTDGTGFEDIFDDLICGPTVSDLIAEGFLSPFKLFAASESMSTQGARTVGGEFNLKDLLKANDIKALSGNLVSMWKRFAPNKRTVVFAINVSHSKAIAARYNQVGIAAEHVDGSTPAAERRNILTRFTSGKTTVLTNCNLVSEGFDLPAIEAVQIARPTQSLALWLQQVGRALRPHPGKDAAILIDHTRNWLMHGLPTQPRLWTLRGVRSPESDLTACPHCNLTFEPARCHRSPLGLACPHCNATIASLLPDFTPSELDIEREPYELPEETSIDLEEVSPAVLELASELLHLQELLELRDRYSRSPDWVVHRLLHMHPNLETWRTCARELGYSTEWASRQHQESIELQAALSYQN